VVDLHTADANLPQDEEFFTVTVAASEPRLITNIEALKAEIEKDLPLQ
jgi:hypothetical protein